MNAENADFSFISEDQRFQRPKMVLYDKERTSKKWFVRRAYSFKNETAKASLNCLCSSSPSLFKGSTM